MKHTLISLLCWTFISLACLNAQDKRFTLSTFTEPYAYKDGFNFGFGIDYQHQNFYIAGKVFTFPNLNDIDYGDFFGSVGLNQHTKFSEWRFYEGFKLGFIFRDGVHPSVGGEAGIQRYFKNWGVGLGGGLNYLTDTYVKRFGHSDDFDYYGRIEIIFEL